MASTEYSVDVDLLIVGAGPVGLYGLGTAQAQLCEPLRQNEGR